MLYEFNLKTHKKTDFIEITDTIRDYVQRSSIQEGVLTIFIPHTTAGVTINENADPAVVSDMEKELDKIVPWFDQYKHMEGNSAAHIKSSLFGTHQQVVIHEGRLILGTWQGIYFAEFDGPRNRKCHIKIVSDI